jgi:hypothetical protein
VKPWSAVSWQALFHSWFFSWPVRAACPAKGFLAVVLHHASERFDERHEMSAIF